MQIRCLQIFKKMSISILDVLILACLKKGRLININCILSENTNNTLMATDIVQVAATKKTALEKK